MAQESRTAEESKTIDEAGVQAWPERTAAGANFDAESGRGCQAVRADFQPVRRVDKTRSRLVALAAGLFYLVVGAALCSGESAAVFAEETAVAQEKPRRRRIPVRMVRPGEATRPVSSTIGEDPVQTAPAGEAEGLTEPVNGGPGGLVGRNAAPTFQSPGGKRLTATRITVPPRLDGLLSDEVWQIADVADDFLQREPREGQTPSDPTEARILYDDRFLYVGFVLHDRSPADIRATRRRRDSLSLGSFANPNSAEGSDEERSGSRSDDTITLLLDTFHDHRDAFVFAINPLGTKTDATVRNEQEVNKEWDERWEAAAQITQRGWEAELAIPFAILRYAGGTQVWGLDIKREIRRTNEEIIWSNHSQDYPFIAVSQAGHLVGLENLGLTERFRLKPFVTGGYNSFEQRAIPTSDGTTDFGIEDFKIKLTSNLTSQLTYNTDFAQVEVDQQRVNLTRFSLFFPEKREFFLEAANNFSFGNVNNRWGNEAPVSRLYFSRRIGLAADGTPLPIDFGTKLTGKIGRGNLGVLNVQTADSRFGQSRNYSVARWRQDVLARSSIGAFFSNVEGPDGELNRVVGADANFNFFDHLTVSGFVAQARDDAIASEPWMGQMRVQWESNLWEADLDVSFVGADFRSELGFIQRTDIIKQTFSGRWKPRPSWRLIRQLNMLAFIDRFTDPSGRVVTQREGVELWIGFESGDSFYINPSHYLERLEVPFPIQPTVIIPPGDYAYNDLWFGFTSYPGRRFSGGVDVNVGEFFDGTLVWINARTRFRFSEMFSIEPSYNLNRVKLPGGSFTAHLLQARTELSFSDRWLTDALAQYNSLSDEFSLFARLRYIYRIGDDFYLVYRHSRLLQGPFSSLNDRSVTAKMTYSFQW